MKYSTLSLALAAAFAANTHAADNSDIETITIEHKQAFRGDIPTKDLPQSIFLCFMYTVRCLFLHRSQGSRRQPTYKVTKPRCVTQSMTSVFHLS